MRKILLTIYFLPVLLLGIIEYTSTEKEWLRSQKKIDVVSSINNFPYEYINQSGKWAGVNYDIIKLIEKELGVTFIYRDPDFVSSDPKIISSLCADYCFDGHKASNKIYEIQYHILKHNKNNEIKKLIVIGQSFAGFALEDNSKIESFEFYTSVKDAFWVFKYDKNAAVIFDVNYWDRIKELMKDNEPSAFIKKVEKKLHYKLLVESDQIILHSIINKAISNLTYSGKIKNVYNNYSDSFNLIDEKHVKASDKLFFIVLIIIAIISIIFFFQRIFVKLKLIDNKTAIFKRTNDDLVKENRLMKIDLENSKSNNKKVYDSLDSIVLIYDAQGIIKFVNHKMKEILGYVPDVLIGNKLNDIVDDKIVENLLSALYSKNKRDIEINSVEGLPKHFNYSLEVHSDKDGELQIICFLQDITARISLENRLEAYANHLEDLVRQRTEKLRLSEEQFRLLVEKVQDSIFLKRDQKFIFVNDKFVDMIGFSKEMISTGTIKFSDLVVPSDINYVSTKISEISESKEGNSLFEFSMKRSDDSEVLVEANITSIIFNDDIAELGIIRDVTEKKRLEMEELEKERLLIASQLAVTANDRINSPLNSITGYLEMIEMRLGDDDKFINRAILNINKSVGIIEKIMSKLQSMNKIILKDYKLKDTQMINLEDIDVEDLSDSSNIKED